MIFVTRLQRNHCLLSQFIILPQIVIVSLLTAYFTLFMEPKVKASVKLVSPTRCFFMQNRSSDHGKDDDVMRMRDAVRIS
jgi:hypothetical protein